MKTENPIQLLREEEVKPTDIVLEAALGKDLFVVYTKLLEIICSEFQMEYEWRFYKDGKSWFCKVVYKKKTVFWLSIWAKFIKTGFYFTEKTRGGIYDLEISTEIKESFKNADAIGKLIPLILDIEKGQQLADLTEIIKYKKSLK